MNYPNLNLYGDLKRCEDDLFELINKNFFLIDTFWMLRVISIVTELPTEPEQGDTYIFDNKIYIFDGTEWISQELKDGMHFYVLDENDFYVFDSVLISFTDKYRVEVGDISILEVTDNKTVVVTDEVLLVNCSSLNKNINITLPSASSYKKILTIKKIDTNENYSVNILRSGSNLIDGETSFELYRKYDSISLVALGSNWSII